MVDAAIVFLALGAAFLLGLGADLLGRHTFLPRVTVLILVGVLIGLFASRHVEELQDGFFETLTDFALAMIGFLLGGKFDARWLQSHGGPVLRYSLFIVLGTSGLVLLGLLAIGTPLSVALVLAAVSAATAPAASHDVVQETGAKGDFPDTLLAIVAIDDAWGLVLFSVLLALAVGFAGQGPVGEILLQGVWELVGAVLIGLVLGLAAAPITGRLEPGEPTQAEALALVLIAAGAALALGVSHILAAVVTGAVVVNRARHHTRPFHEVAGIEWPFLILFFLLAGATLEVSRIPEAGLLLAGFIGLRVAGRFAGSWAAGRGRQKERFMRRWMGPALLPQAGVAIGMAVVASNRLPEHGEAVLTVTLASTVFFEVLGPVFTRAALKRSAM